MKFTLTWKTKDNVLILNGGLNRDTLSFFWKNRKKLLVNINIIDISQLSNIDSSGLAMLVRLKLERLSSDELVFCGISERFKILLDLYKVDRFF